MLALIKNEWIKLWQKRTTQIFTILLFLVPVVIAIGGKTLAGQLVGCPLQANDLLQSLGSITVPYHLALALIVSAIVADEYSGGTIKNLLIQPFTRNQILLSKYIVSLLLNAVYAVGLWFDLWLSGNFILGFQSPLATVPGSAGTSVLLASLGMLFSVFWANILIVSGTFLLSTLFTWPGLAMAFSVLMLVVDNFCSAVATIYMLGRGMTWLKWNPFNVFNMNKIFGMKIMHIPLHTTDLHYWQMMLMCVCYSGICYLLSTLIFKHRDIKLHDH